MGSAVPKWFRYGAKNLACRADFLARVNGVSDHVTDKELSPIGRGEVIYLTFYRKCSIIEENMKARVDNL